MANLKLDLINKINNDKYYDELELVRLAQDPNMIYKDKIDSMNDVLSNIAIYNAQLGLVEQYFDEPQTPVQTPVSVPVGNNGQSHQE